MNEINDRFHALCLTNATVLTKDTLVSGMCKRYGISSFDVVTYGAQKWGIADIRRLIVDAQNKPFNSPQKIIVLEANEISFEAQQALLKTLEELPDHTFFLLCVSSEHVLLPTILSRLHIIRGQQIPIDNDKERLDFWRNLMLLPPFERLSKLTDFPSKRDELIAQFEIDVVLFRQQLLTAYAKNGNKQSSLLVYVRIIRLIQATLHRLRSNITLKLTLDHLLLGLPKLDIQPSEALSK